MEQIQSCGDLQQELDNAKNTLVSLNDNIRRIIGRSPKDIRNGKQKLPNNDTSKFKRRAYDAKSVFNRLSALESRSAEEEVRNTEVKPRLTSRVIRELPTRQEILAAQCTDSESRARNRRMFGSLMGTLHKFCQEEISLKQKEDKKAQIEKKLEEQELQERISIKREREMLFMNRKKKQLEIKKLEIKMNILRDFEVWEKSVQPLRNYIKSKTKPSIFYKPKIMCKKTTKLLIDSQSNLENAIKKRHDSINKELSELKNSLTLDNIDSIDNNNDVEIRKNHEDMEIDVDDPIVHTNYQNNKASFENKIKVEVETKENKVKSSKEQAVGSSHNVLSTTLNEIQKSQ